MSFAYSLVSPSDCLLTASKFATSTHVGREQSAACRWGHAACAGSMKQVLFADFPLCLRSVVFQVNHAIEQLASCTKIQFLNRSMQLVVRVVHTGLLGSIVVNLTPLPSTRLIAQQAKSMLCLCAKAPRQYQSQFRCTETRAQSSLRIHLVLRIPVSSSLV